MPPKEAVCRGKIERQPRFAISSRRSLTVTTTFMGWMRVIFNGESRRMKLTIAQIDVLREFLNANVE